MNRTPGLKAGTTAFAIDGRHRRVSVLAVPGARDCPQELPSSQRMSEAQDSFEEQSQERRAELEANALLNEQARLTLPKTPTSIN